MRTYTGETARGVCRWCGADVWLRRFVEDGEAGWERTEHPAPCGLPCRTNDIGRAHGRKFCSVCGPITAKRRRHIRRTHRRRLERERTRRAA